MNGYKRFASAGQMAVGLGVFAVLTLVLDSGGLSSWAQRLELGPERTIAVPVTNALQSGLRSLGLERLRRLELAELARVGWSDDPEEERAYGTEFETVMPVTPPSSRFGEELLSKPGVSGMVPMAALGVGAGTGTVPHTPKLPLQPMAGDPPLVNALPGIAGVPVGKVRTVALVGDSMMAVGLSSTMLRGVAAYPDLTLVSAFKSGTGLSRPEVFDWQAEYPAMLGGAKPDVIVVAIGANDGQGFVEDGVTYPFGTDGWTRIYERRVEAFLAMLERSGATVVWVGLPPMKSGSYNARIALVNRIDYAVVQASPQAVWFSSAGVVGDSDGRFEDYGEVRGSMTRLRQPDGIHMSDEGASLLTAKLLPWLAKQEAVPVKMPAEKVSTEVAGKASSPQH